MERTFWHKQTASQPLFPDLEWSRPETTVTAGKLLIIGGNAQGFAAPAEAYIAASGAGVGTARVVLPERVKSLVGNLLETVEYALSNPSGGFSQPALDGLLEQTVWADGVLLAGDFGRNSETAVLLEKFLSKYVGQVTLTKDAVDYFTHTPASLLGRENTSLVLSFAQLQKLATNAHFETAFTFDMDLLRLVDALHDFSQQHAANIVTKHLNNMLVAVDGEVSSTKFETAVQIWRVKTAASASVWWLQNPTQSFKALTTAIHTVVH